MTSFSDSTSASQGRGLYAVPLSDHVDNVVLKANTPTLVPVPLGMGVVAFCFTASIFVGYGGPDVVAGVPSTTTTNGLGVELNPGIRRIPKGEVTHMSIVSAQDAVGSISYYK